MKRSRILFCLSLLMCLLVSCETEFRDYDVLTVNIRQIESENPDEVCFQLEPSPGTTSFKYVITQQSNPEAFISGEIEGIQTVEGDQAVTVTCEDLIPQSFYYVYAQAFTADERGGGLATYKYQYIRATDFHLVQQYNLYGVAAFLLEYPAHFPKCRFALGLPEDREAFLNGTFSGIQVHGDCMGAFVVTYPNLKPGTNYVFYAQTKDLIGVESELYEIPFTSPSKDQSPYAEMEIVHQDAFREIYKVIPNAECGKIIALFNEVGEGAAGIVNSIGWNGDWMNLILSWSRGNSKNPELLTYSSLGEPLVIQYDDYTFSNSAQKYMKAVLFDKTGKNPMGVIGWNFKKSSLPSSAHPSKVTLQVTDVTAKGATYTYHADEHTLGYFFDTVDADWWDENKKDFLRKDRFYLHNLLKQDHKFIYGKDQETYRFTEQTGKPGKRYYAVACPCNKKGPGAGWEELVCVEYTTKTE